MGWVWSLNLRIQDLFKIIIVPFLVPSFLGLIAIDSEAAGGDIAIKWAFSIFFVPMTVVFLLLAFSLPREPLLQWRIFRVACALISAAIITYVSMGYFDFVNVLTGSKQPVLVSGTITKMKAESGRWAGKLHNITVRYGDRDIMLTVTPKEFDQLKIGEVYSREMKLGGLGYYYAWGLAFWK
jgi:hypothetical protein